MTSTPACRFGDRCQLRTFEDVIECVGSHSDTTRTEIARRVATVTGRSEAYLRSCLSVNDGTHQLQLAVIPALIAASGNVAPLRWLAQQSGFGIHRIPAATGDRRDAVGVMLDCFDALNDAAQFLRRAAKDGLTAQEARDFTVRAHRVVAEIVAAIAEVNFRVEAPR